MLLYNYLGWKDMQLQKIPVAGWSSSIPHPVTGAKDYMCTQRTSWDAKPEVPHGRGPGPCMDAVGKVLDAFLV